MRTGKRYIAGIAALLLVVPLAQMGGAAKKRQRVRSSLLAEGVNYTRILDRSGPFRIKVVDVDLSSSTTLDTVLAKDRLPKLETTSSMAQRTGALAAINGDYARPSGRPVFAFAADGALAQTSLSWGRNFSTGFNESVTYIGHPQESVWVQEDSEGGALLPVSRVNHSAEDAPIGSAEVRMFTAQGKKDAKPPAGQCAVRLQPNGEPLAQADGSGVRQSFVVETVSCPGTRLHPAGGIVLVSSLDSQYLLALQGMVPGETVT
jgi:hypothetical protein